MWEIILAFLQRVVGNRNDTASATGSIHAKLKELRDAKIGTTADTRATGSVMGHLNSMVKSVQRGTAVLPSSNGAVNVTIASINLSKAVIQFSFDSSAGTGGYQDFRDTFVRGKILNATTIQFNRTSTTGPGVNIDWEVIEYY